MPALIMYPGERNEILKLVQACLIIIYPFSNYFPSPDKKVIMSQGILMEKLGYLDEDVYLINR